MTVSFALPIYWIMYYWIYLQSNRCVAFVGEIRNNSYGSLKFCHSGSNKTPQKVTNGLTDFYSIFCSFHFSSLRIGSKLYFIVTMLEIIYMVKQRFVGLLEY